MKIISRFIFPLLLLVNFIAVAQKQVVLLKKENVILRLHPGDEFIFKLKGSKKITTTYVNNLLESAVVTHRDTVAFERLERIYFRQSTFYNRMGTRFVILGTGLFLIDQINTTLIQGEDFSVDNTISTISLSAMAVGLPMMLIKKKSQKLTHKYRLLTITKGSPFYRADPREAVSPFLN